MVKDRASLVLQSIQLQGSGAKISVATKSDLVLRDLDPIKTFPNARVSWSVNTLDESFREDTDNAVSIERRLAAMKIFHDAGVRTTCFISPVFPGIAGIKAIIGRAKDNCNLIWLENLNLRGTFEPQITEYITKKNIHALCLSAAKYICAATTAIGNGWTRKCANTQNKSGRTI